MRMTALLIAALAAGAVATAGGEVTRRAESAGCTVAASPANAQSRIDAARAGDVVCLDEGVFRGRLVVYGKTGVTVRGAGAHRTVVSGGTSDGIVVVNSSGVTIEDFTLYSGVPANVYIGRSSDVTVQRMDIGAGAIGVHVDDGSTARVADSFIYAIRGDGVLVRRGSGVTVERSWIFNNTGVGLSFVGNVAPSSVVRNIISDNRGPGIFAGAPPCAGLPGASLAVPGCFLANPGAYVGSAALTLDTNVVQASGSTGIVLFPGTTATMRGNRVWRNHMTGLFAWGATVYGDGDEYDGNDEHAIEVRSYPDPFGYMRAGGRLNNAEVRNTAVWPGTGTLGGGVLLQGATFDVTNSRIHDNAGIGLSYQNGATGRAEGNAIANNRGAGLCLYGAGYVVLNLNSLSGNATNVPGAC